MGNFITDFFAGGIEGAAKGIGSLAKDIRSAITGEEPVGNETKVKLAEVAAQLEAIEQQLPMAVNKTMRAEAKSDHWAQWLWRPTWGFISAGAFGFVVVLCCWLAYRAIVQGQMEALDQIPQLITSFSTLFAVPMAIVGVTAYHRGKEKRGL